MRPIPFLFAASALVALAVPSQAQDLGGWGQPYYGGGYAHASPRSEAHARTHSRLGAAGDGQGGVEVPAVPGGWGPSYGRDRGGRYGWSSGPRRWSAGRPAATPRPGYRDEWGYQDDRPPSRWRAFGYGYGRDYRGRCDCPDVYLYDR